MNIKKYVMNKDIIQNPIIHIMKLLPKTKLD